MNHSTDCFSHNLAQNKIPFVTGFLIICQLAELIIVTSFIKINLKKNFQHCRLSNLKIVNKISNYQLKENIYFVIIELLIVFLITHHRLSNYFFKEKLNDNRKLI